VLQIFKRFRSDSLMENYQIGDYPKVPLTPRYLRNPYIYDDIGERRNFGEEVLLQLFFYSPFFKIFICETFCMIFLRSRKFLHFDFLSFSTSHQFAISKLFEAFPFFFFFFFFFLFWYSLFKTSSFHSSFLLNCWKDSFLVNNLFCLSHSSMNKTKRLQCKPPISMITSATSKPLEGLLQWEDFCA